MTVRKHEAGDDQQSLHSTRHADFQGELQKEGFRGAVSVTEAQSLDHPERASNEKGQVADSFQL